MVNLSIPEITKEELVELYKRIKPIVEIEGEKYFLRDFTEEELTDISYIWNKVHDKRELVDMDIFVPCVDFECIHKYGYWGMFKPSIAEILVQIPKNYLKFVDAFEIIEFPKTKQDMLRNKIVFERGFHVSKVRLYASRNNPNVDFN